MMAIFANDFLSWTRIKSHQMLKHTRQLYFLLVLCCFVFAICFFITVYIEPDTRISAAEYATKLFSNNASLESEVYDLGITPFNPKFSNIKLFNFYDLDNPSPETNNITLQLALNNSEGIILPSQRILKTRLLNKNKFPVGYNFYYKLFAGKLPFHLVYVTPCDIFCKIAYAGSPVLSYEETANVFDRPTLYIFKKINK